MIKVKWNIEEAAVLVDCYIKNGSGLSVPEYELDTLTTLFRKRAVDLGILFDEKFRNRSGLKMQIACIHYVATDGAEGMSNASKLFYEAYELYSANPKQFEEIVRGFYRKYS